MFGTPQMGEFERSQKVIVDSNTGKCPQNHAQDHLSFTELGRKS